MRIAAVVQIVAALVVAASSSPTSTTHHVVHERRSRSPQHWTRHSRLHPEAVLPIRIGLTQQNLHRAEEFINQVSHPDSELYGQHWSPERIIKTFAPQQESIDAVHAWLEGSGIDLRKVRMSTSMSWMEFNATASQAENLLKTEYHLYEHTSGHAHVACNEYSLPAHLTEHIDIVTPTVHFDKRIGAPRHMERGERLPEKLRNLNKRELETTNSLHGILGSPQDASNPKQGAAVVDALMTLDNCDSMITPACLRALYNMPPGSTAQANNTLGVVEYTPQAFLQGDLDVWFKQFSPNQVGTFPDQKLIDGAIVQTQNQSFNFNGESALDLQYAMEMIFPQTVTLYQVGDLVNGASFNNFLDALDGSYCTFQGGGSKDPSVDGQYPDTNKGGFNGPEQCGTVAATNVISTSYSANEADLGAKYEMRQCLEYMKLGLQGVSILYSSGDFGVAGNGGQCISETTLAYNNGSSGIFNPSFPGTCPYITSVGATQILNGSTVHTPESAAERVIFSGGGFSNNFALPSYQESAMKAYFANSPPPYGADRFNNSQKVRGYPDVSANGVNYVVAVNGAFSLAFGTSASCPVFAALLSAINEQRLAANKSPVGFVNPALYANPGVMNDISTGTNQGCGTTGFTAVPGWDPVTGLGTPNFPAMLDMFMKLP
jgi:tripeptidyl-peptidase-1